MPVNSILMDFLVADSQMATVEGQMRLSTILRLVLEKYVPELTTVHSSFCEKNGFFVVFAGKNGAHCTVRGFLKGIISCNIEYFREENEEALVSFEVTFEPGSQAIRLFDVLPILILCERIRALLQNSQDLGTELKSKLNCSRYKVFPCLRRGCPFDVYLTTSGMLFG